MNNLSDIDEVNSTIGDSFRLVSKPHSTHTMGSEDITSKRSVMFAVDQSVLELFSGDSEGSDYSDDRQRDPLLGSCCDLIRAVIFIDIFYIVKNICLIITICFGWMYTDPDDFNLRYYTDDEMEATVEQLDILFWILMAKNICGIIFASIGIYGCSRFSKYMILSTTIFACIDILWSIMFSRWISTGLTIFFIYPHVALFWALHKGKITHENYGEIKHCCCQCCIKENSGTEPEVPARESGQPTGTSTEKSSGENSGYKSTEDPFRLKANDTVGSVKSVTAPSA